MQMKMERDTVNRRRCTRLAQAVLCGTVTLAVAGLLLIMAGGCAARALAVAEGISGGKRYVEGALAYHEGDRVRAIAALRSALEENPNLIMARFLLGTIYREKGDYEAAAAEYRRVVELDPYSYTNHYNLGLMYHLLNRLQEAAVSYLQALKLNPQDPKSNMNLGLVYTALGNAELGLPYVRRAVELAPTSAEAHANLAVVYDSLRDYRSAETAYRRAIELDPGRVETAVNLAGCLLAQKRYAEAVSVYEQLLRENDGSLLRERYGHALLYAGRVEDAIRQFETALKLDARNFHACNGLGEAMLAQYRQGFMLDETKRNEAIRWWRKSLQINPHQPRIEALLIEYDRNTLFP